jgi:DNA-3-methyladenine glycosylase
MVERRGLMDSRLLASGPGRLCQALGVGLAQNGAPMTSPPFRLEIAPTLAEVATGPRIGITKAVDTPWRFGLAGSRYLSKPFRA